MDADSIGDLQLALGEAAGNAVEHAYRDAAVPGRVLVELDVDDDGGLTVAVTDTGDWRPAPADPGHRGRGLQIIRALTQDVDVIRGPDGTVVRFRFRPSGPPTDAGFPAAPPPAEAPAAVVVSDADGERRIQIAGDLDHAGVTGVRDTLLEALDGANHPQLTIDLTELGWLASVGVGLLLDADARAGSRAEFLLPLPGPARRVLDLTGVSAVLGRAHAAAD
jgi:anti-anti-sigma factor